MHRPGAANRWPGLQVRRLRKRQEPALRAPEWPQERPEEWWQGLRQRAALRPVLLRLARPQVPWERLRVSC